MAMDMAMAMAIAMAWRLNAVEFFLNGQAMATAMAIGFLGIALQSIQ